MRISMCFLFFRYCSTLGLNKANDSGNKGITGTLKAAEGYTHHRTEAGIFRKLCPHLEIPSDPLDGVVAVTRGVQESQKLADPAEYTSSR